MGKLIYMMNTSLDGYTEDEHGDFSFAAPRDPELHEWILQHVAQFRTCLYGRKVYETMSYWETAHLQPDQSQAELDFAAAWQSAEKIVYSKTLTKPRSARTGIEREFDAEAVRRLKASVEHEISVGGTELGAVALRASVVDEIRVRIAPVIIGGGKRFLPAGVRLKLELLDEKRFTPGDIFLSYAVRNAAE